ncbi:MAG: 50S ribosomal protein L25 [Meiothermus sp.]|uniref:50S ribosomal protein L25 n=1 Tax=Meiothermus sp. TaxID=1955249 RepID=UPI0025CE48FF|nr:50S ribosomal protein L25 [Meiothermus sp.]MCS7058365.1 50S ribosomal protein L25 [Meiothermus sp.]MCS7194371.1 50S ribosomal protein L25 [Meiothermus sp.]MDW8089852.1 50S ribosomal protein L25 [Meiothermus sp.]MDW8481722.1 50S ribosomal protein L25 [Meiothermus sp.]
MEYRIKAQTRGNERPEALRNAGKLPGVVYNRHENYKVAVDLKEFNKVFLSAGIHHVITLEFEGGKKVDTLVRQVNLDKRRRRPEHVDFYALSDEPVQMWVPVKVVGTAQGVREGGVLQLVNSDIQVRVSPKAIPEFIEVDVSHLRIGDSIHADEVSLPPGVKLAMNPRDTIVAIVPPEDAEKLAAEAAEAPTEVEVIKKGKAEEEK